MVQDSKSPLPSSAMDVPSFLLGKHRDAVLDSLRRAMPLGDDGLYGMLRYHLGWADAHGNPIAVEGGKMLRPVVCLLACEWLKGRWQDCLPAAAALELCHNFSLIHDDIQDGDTERRHKPTVWAVWGQPRALVAGDVLLSVADMAVLAGRSDAVTANLSPEVALGISGAFTRGYLDMVEGQYLDLSYEGSLAVTVEQYLDMAGRKTGALFQCAMSMGALVAAGDQQVAGVMGRCGRLFGLAFQIRDDVLGIWGTSDTLGKAIGSDIRRRKKSLPVVHALANARGAGADALRRIYSQDKLSEDDVQEVLTIMDSVSTQEFCQKLAETKGQEAMEVVASLHLESWAMQELQDLITFVVTRQS